ncbi:unnamed protein product [Porites lobata]|uniref:Aspartyl/asparaginy/proline hydroxylase domain-containing protein n=1 Tax=Porites lobata TaxID=104759 RepID=A0ABN8PRE3_9CNID|nr:unnamed protein product [Porites lobata]
MAPPRKRVTGDKNKNTDSGHGSARTKQKESEPRRFPYIKWLVILSVILLASSVIFYIVRALHQQDLNLEQKTKTQTVETEVVKPTERTKKKAKKEKSHDPLAAITNSFDKSIAKELDKAQSILDKGQIGDALRKFEGLVNKYPKSPRALYGKAQSLDKLADLKQSNEVLQQSIEAYGNVVTLPDCPLELKRRVMRRQADRLSFLGRIGQAANVLKKLLNLFPGDIKLMNELGVQYLLSGRNRDAESIYNQVINMDPTNGFAKSHLGFILKTDHLRYVEAIPLLREGISSGHAGADDGRFYFHLGDALTRVGKPDEAYKVYAEAAGKGIFLSALQRSLYNADTPLKAQPFWTPKETGYLTAIQKLEANWKVIRDEGLSVLDKKTGGFIPEEENLRQQGDWKQFTMYQRGRKNAAACQKTPQTCAIIDTIHDATSCKRGQIKYSVMLPGTHVWPHTGPTNCRLRLHLGLVIPKHVAIRVGRETKTWEEGKAIIIDDSFDHEVWHNGSSFRLILIVDFWHPDLTARQRASLSPI